MTQPNGHGTHTANVRWDRFDICEAWYVYSVLFHSGQSSKEYRILGRLTRIRFKPGLSVRSKAAYGLSENARRILHRLLVGESIIRDA